MLSIAYLCGSNSLDLQYKHIAALSKSTL